MVTVNTREDYLKELAKLLPPQSTCVEIGVMFGDFSQMILDIIRPYSLVLVDPFEVNEDTYGETLRYCPTAYSDEYDYKKVIERFHDQLILGQVNLVRKYSYEAVKPFPDNHFDFVYNDGSHKYEDVKKDLADWLPKLKPDGIMCGHDLINLDDFGVIQAVAEFIQEHNFEMILFNDNGGDWALRRKHE